MGAGVCTAWVHQRSTGQEQAPQRQVSPVSGRRKNGSKDRKKVANIKVLLQGYIIGNLILAECQAQDNCLTSVVSCCFADHRCNSCEMLTCTMAEAGLEGPLISMQ